MNIFSFDYRPKCVAAAALILASVFTAHGQPASFWELENEVQTQMMETYGYYVGTRTHLQVMTAKWPDAKDVIAQADRRFVAAYGASAEAIDRLLTRKNGTWPSQKAEYHAGVRAQVEQFMKDASSAVATNALIEIEARCRGAIQSPWAETLLMHKPEYVRQPELEFRDGYRKVFRSTSHPMTAGINFQLRLPQSWSAATTRLTPATGLPIFCSENGRGLHMVNVVAIDHPFDNSTNQTGAALRAQFEPEAVKKMLPETGLQDARYVRSDNQLTIGGHPAGLVEFTFESRSSQGLQSARAIWYVIWLPEEAKSVLLQFAVFHVPLEPSLEETFRRYTKLFEAVAFSFLLGDKPVEGAVANPYSDASASSRMTAPVIQPAPRTPTPSGQPNWRNDEAQRQSEERRRREQQLEDERRQQQLRLQQGQWQRQQEEQRRRDLERQRQQQRPGWR